MWKENACDTRNVWLSSLEWRLTNGYVFSGARTLLFSSFKRVVWNFSISPSAREELLRHNLFISLHRKYRATNTRAFQQWVIRGLNLRLYTLLCEISLALRLREKTTRREQLVCACMCAFVCMGWVWVCVCQLYMRRACASDLISANSRNVVQHAGRSTTECQYHPTKLAASFFFIAMYARPSEVLLTRRIWFYRLLNITRPRLRLRSRSAFEDREQDGESERRSWTHIFLQIVNISSRNFPTRKNWSGTGQFCFSGFTGGKLLSSWGGKAILRWNWL